MDTDKRSGAFSIQVKVAYMKVASGLFEICLRRRVHGARQTEFRVVRDLKCMIEVASLDDGQYRSKYLFLLDGGSGLDVIDHGWLDKESILIDTATAGHDLATFVDSLFDIAKRVIERTLIDDGSDICIALRRDRKS